MNTEKNEELYEGETIKIRGKEYVFPGLSLGQIERFADDIEEVSKNDGTFDKKMIGTCVQIIHAALSRNYPEITVEEVKDMLDLRNMKTVFYAVMGTSGFEKSDGKGGNSAKGATLKRP